MCELISHSFTKVNKILTLPVRLQHLPELTNQQPGLLLLLLLLLLLWAMNLWAPLPHPLKLRPIKNPRLPKLNLSRTKHKHSLSRKHVSQPRWFVVHSGLARTKSYSASHFDMWFFLFIMPCCSIDFCQSCQVGQAGSWVSALIEKRYCTSLGAQPLCNNEPLLSWWHWNEPHLRPS